MRKGIFIVLLSMTSSLLNALDFSNYNFADHLRNEVFNPENEFKSLLDKYAGWRVGNGGDGVRLTFKMARENAAHIAQRMNAGAFSKPTSTAVKEFILSNKQALSADILTTKHVWIPDEKFSCAWTTTPTSRTDSPPKQTILFSYPTCKKTTIDLKHAVFLLIHESVHHFGVADEEFADSVAGVIVSAWESGTIYWQEMPAADEKYAREGHAAAYIDKKLLFYGGLDQARKNSTNSLSILESESGKWFHVETTGGPSRYNHDVHPYKNKIIIWGGFERKNRRQSWKSDGAIYDLKSKRWTKIKPPQQFSSREMVYAVEKSVVIGNGFMVWGGKAGGFIYDLKQKTFGKISQSGAPIRSGGHSLTNAGSSTIVWGGKDEFGRRTNSGAIYNLIEDSWTRISTANAPPASIGHTALWTGNKLIIFGGYESSSNLKGTGGVYDPVFEAWQPIETEVAIARVDHQAVWTGSEMLIFGGKSKRMRTYLGDVLAFNPNTSSWRVVNSRNAPSSRSLHSMVWAGGKIAVWGGQNREKKILNSGGYFFP